MTVNGQQISLHGDMGGRPSSKEQVRLNIG